MSSTEASAFDDILPDSAKRQAARDSMREVLLDGADLFRRLLVPESIKNDDPAIKLFNQFDQNTLNALRTLFFDLERILFNSAESIYSGSATETRELAWYVPYKETREISDFIKSVLYSDPFPGKAVVTDFLRVWVKTVRVNITPPLDAGGANLLRVAGTPSESAALNRWAEKMEEIEARFNNALDAVASADVAKRAADDSVRARDLARQAAGDAGAATLGGHFKQIADKEADTAFRWTLVSMTSLIAIIGVGAWIVYQTGYAHWVETLLHLVIVLPLIALATLAARLASYHRLLGRWAKTAAVQINTVAAFAEQLPTDESRQELILQSGRTVFGPAVFGDMQADNMSGIPPDLIDLLKEVVKKYPGGK